MSENTEKMIADRDKDIEQEWRENDPTGRIYARLEAVAKLEKLPLTIEDRGSAHEFIVLGKQGAAITKHLTDSVVGSTGGTIKNYIESWQYKRYPWWREALDAEGLPAEFLDPAVGVVAREAGIEQWREIFTPRGVAKTLAQTIDVDGSEGVALQTWAFARIREVVDPLIHPDYRVIFQDDTIRLSAQSEGARKSRVEDNDAYKQAMEALKIAAPKLQAIFEARAAELRKDRT